MGCTPGGGCIEDDLQIAGLFVEEILHARSTKL